MTKIVFPALAAACACAIAAMPAHADELRVPVSYGTLDVATLHGATQLADRIDMNVSQACGRFGDVRDLTANAQCRAGMLANAAAQLEAQGHMLAASSVEARI